ncbi:nuclear transport factor 2 family protein [Marihabitans asiaticum]|uniref:Ketosteroid isomerase-like protein n=1 Tax=Marihabitans asiaticum TaxID=415218 RepID=A0A560W9T1_9MICO|nr:nuclear transport factor 2 family protein [Marihabitans asiaticum]TWD14378.1 ketosteroid isomerase-like protein [Marihabitans asiaticum]
MSADLTATTLRYYAMVDAGDVDGVIDWFAPEATYWRPGYPPMVGREALREFYGGERVIEYGAHTVEDLLVDGDRVAVRGRFEGELKDGSTARLGFADFLRYDGDGRVVERRSYFDTPAV